MDFSASEISTIRLFFGLPKCSISFELSELYFLESGSVEHPSGDRLEVLPHGFVVYIACDNHPHPYYFTRDFRGLIQALERLTAEIS